MNLTELDTNTTPFLIGLAPKGTEEFFMVVKPNIAYQLPPEWVGREKELTYVRISIPSQENDELTVELQNGVCPRCGGEEKHVPAICTELSVGFKSKWFCTVCSHIIYSMEEA